MEKERIEFIQKEQLEQDDPLGQKMKLQTYQSVQDKLKQRDMEEEYLSDERDIVEGDITDSDEEFQAIVEVDAIINQLMEYSSAGVKEDALIMSSQESMVVLTRKVHAIMELVEWENKDMRTVFEEVVAFELIDITNLEWTLEIAKLAYEMELPYSTFWAALTNVLLLNHQEFTLSDDKKSLIDLTYYVLKANRSKHPTNQGDQLMSLDLNALPSGMRKNKLAKKAQLKVLMAYLQDEAELSEGQITLVQKLNLLTVDAMLDFQVLTGSEQREYLVKEVINYFTIDLDGLALALERFNYD